MPLHKFSGLCWILVQTLSDQRAFNLCRFLAMVEQRLHSTHFLLAKTSLMAFYWARTQSWSIWDGSFFSSLLTKQEWSLIPTNFLSIVLQFSKHLVYWQYLPSTVLLDIKRRHSIIFSKFRLVTMVIFHNFCPKIQNKKWPKITIVCPKCASWRSNQEWRSISTNTVYCFYDFGKVTNIYQVIFGNPKRL